MPRIPFRFGEFAPDSEEFENSTIEKLENGLPIYSGYRSVREAEVKSTVEQDLNYVTGAHAHLITDDVTVQHGKVDADTTDGTWYNELFTQTDLFASLDELIPNDDDDFIFWESAAGSDPSATQARLEVETLVDPAVAADHDYHLDVRYSGYLHPDATDGTLTIKLYEDTTPISGQTGDDWEATGDPEFWNDTWRTKRLTLHDDDADLITDFSDLNLRFDGDLTTAAQDDTISYPTKDGEYINAPVPNGSDVWEREDGTDENLYASMDSVTEFGDPPEDTEYVVTKPGIETSNAIDAAFRVLLNGARFPYSEEDGVQIKIRAKRVGAGITFRSVVGGVPYTEFFAANDTWETFTHTLHHLTIKSFSGDDWEDFPVDIEVSGISDSAEQSSVPTGNGSPNQWESGAWSGSGPSADFSDIDLEDNDYISAKGTSALTYRFTLPLMTEPSNHTATKVNVKHKYTGGSNSPTIQYRLYQNGTYLSKNYQPITDWEEETWTLSESDSQSLDWGSTFTMEVVKKAGADREVRVDYVEIETEGGTTKCYIGDIWLEVPSTQGFHVTWADLIVPSATTEVRGDKIRIYAGSEEKLWGVSESGWEDLTRLSGDYGQGSDKPQTWDFCSWGGNVITTNYEDEIQQLDLEAGATEFAKLTAESDATEYSPRAKFCDIVGNHLVVGNIGSAVDGDGPTAFTDVYSYSVWWSAINDPTIFRIGDYANLSDLQHLRQTPGELTGFVGGEFGTWFKRDSIYRQSWVGGNLVFRFDVLARGVGTSSPKSIVNVNGNIFFYGHNDFYVMPGGGQPQPISGGKIKAMLLESFWEERAVNRNDFTYQVDNDLRVVGTYDQFTGLIFWCIDNYQTNSDFTSKSDILVYNPSDNRFGYIRDARFSDSATLGISDIVASPNIQQDDVAFLNNLHLFTYDTSPGTTVMNLEKFTGGWYLPMEILTNTIASDSIGAEPGDIITMSSVRPFYDRIASRDSGEVSDSEGSNLNLPFTASLFSSYDQLMIDDVSTAMATLGSDNINKWASLSKILNGEFYKIKLNIPRWEISTDSSAGYGAVKTLLGLQLDVRMAGKN